MKPGRLLAGMMYILAVTGAIRAEDATALEHPDRLKALTVIKGKVSAMDVEGKQLTVEDDAHQRVTLRIALDTVVSDVGNHAFSWKSLKVGDPVEAYYEPKHRVADHIDREPTPAESLLNIDHPEKDSLGGNKPGNPNMGYSDHIPGTTGTSGQ
jgi:hypothetical protein